MPNDTQDPDPEAPTAPQPPAAGAPGDDYAAMLAAFEGSGAVRLAVGEQVRGKVFHISRENVFVSLSPSQEGVLPLAELTGDDGRHHVALGDVLDAFVVSTQDGIVLGRQPSREHGGLSMLAQAREAGMPVDAVVTGANKGGLEVEVGGLRAFCPMGQVDVGFVEDPGAWVGRTLTFLVTEVQARGRNVVLSRRAYLTQQRAAQAAQLLQTLAVGARLTGTVSRLADFGAFVDLGGVDGLVPMRELAHQRLGSAAEAVREGEQVAVQVLAIEADPKRPGSQRITLSRRACLDDPWVLAAAALQPGATLDGQVVRLEPFGAFVAVLGGIEGLVHISEMSHRRLRHPDELLQVGQPLQVRLLRADLGARRLALSLLDVGAAAAGGGGGRVGQDVEATVASVEPFGVLVEIDGGGSGLLPAAHTGTPRGTDLSRAFPPGSRLSLQITGKDERGRLRLSKVARERSDERALVDSYGAGGAAQSLGTLGDLLRQRGAAPPQGKSKSR